jgi:nucleoporin NUP82
MPRILSHTPGWLSRPSPGFDVFSAPPHKSTPAPIRDAEQPTAPSRLIARRGTQIFVAVDNEVRWTDLLLLKDYEEQNGSGRRKKVLQSTEDIPESMYRVSGLEAQFVLKDR